MFVEGKRHVTFNGIALRCTGVLFFVLLDEHAQTRLVSVLPMQRVFRKLKKKKMC